MGCCSCPASSTPRPTSSSIRRSWRTASWPSSRRSAIAAASSPASTVASAHSRARSWSRRAWRGRSSARCASGPTSPRAGCGHRRRTMARRTPLGLPLIVVAAGRALAAELSAAKPEQVGLSSERLDRITQVLRADVERGRIPGAVVLVARKGRVAYLQPVGFRDKDSGAPMTADAIFRIASMTKPMVTVAALSLYEEGRLLLSDPVSKYIPAFKEQKVGLERAAVEREMAIQDLMRHTSGLTYGNRGTTEIYKMYPQSSNERSEERRVGKECGYRCSS